MHVIQKSNDRTSDLDQVRETTLLSIKLTITDMFPRKKLFEINLKSI